MLPNKNTSNYSLYCGGSCRASGGVNAGVPFIEDFLLWVDGLMARLMPKSVNLETKDTMFNNILLGLRSWCTRGGFWPGRKRALGRSGELQTP